ncbi:hypothetical protein FB45DRAFT_908068 [Roridomyces roridus]|uniref:NTF2 domain-containing protein n=1 Tax=Roridomyces roridus TaxID=1738132 RepID=A0AAD7C2C2_9AGAR|nr:hypothetical protein FB45DRAFT_908068 [Roridomyces roridus]
MPEDSQPNERIDKRKAAPALVQVQSNPPPRSPRGRPRARGRGRGGGSNSTSFAPPRLNTQPRHPPVIQTSVNSNRKPWLPDATNGHFAPNPFRLPDNRNGHFGPKNPPVMTDASVSRVPSAPRDMLRHRDSTTSSVASVSRSLPPLARQRPVEVLSKAPVASASKAPVSRTFNSPPLSKRRRLDTDVPVTIKCEPPPSPYYTPSSAPLAPLPPRRSVTSGSKRYFPVPDICKRDNAQYQDNRRNWMLRECANLRTLGLRVVKYFFRDDGMVLEWTSAEPVWLDTLRPVHPRNPTPPHEIIDVDAESPPPSVPDRPVSVISVPSSPTPEVISPEAEQERLHQLGIEFLLKYISTFDNDRSSLAAAYSEDAIFSFRDNNFASADHFTFQRPRLAHSKSNMPKLPALQNYRFAPQDNEIVLDYDTVVQECMVDTPPRVILTVYGQLVGPDQRTLGIDQWTDWPLLAISHHMVVRDKPWVHWKGTWEKLFT